MHSALLRPPRLTHRGRKPLRRSGSHGTARAWRHSTSASGSAHWAAKPETGTFGHEPALVARTCSPAKLLGFLKLAGTPRCNDARRCHPWHYQGAPAAMAWRRPSRQPRRVASHARNSRSRAPRPRTALRRRREDENLAKQTFVQRRKQIALTTKFARNPTSLLLVKEDVNLNL